MLVSTLVQGAVLIYVSLVAFCHAALYPGGAEQGQSPTNNGAPQGFGQGWGPTSSKQGAVAYLQAIRQMQEQFKNLFPPRNSQNNNNNFRPPPPTLPRAPTPPRAPGPPFWMPKPSAPSPSNAPPKRQPPMPSPFLGPPPQQPPPQPRPPAPAPHQQYMPPQRPMAGGGECGGGYRPGMLCCDGIVNPLPKGGVQQWGCCHKGIYDMNTQVCCGDVPVPKPRGGPPMLCCGMSLYNPRTHICCDKFPMPNQGGTLKCCRKNAFNPVTQMCCGESVKPRPPGQRHMDCCGKHMYNPLTHMCCEEGNTFLKTPTTQCCGKNVFTPATQQCCFGDPFPKGSMCMAK